MRLLNAKEVSEILHVSVSRVYELCRRGVLPHVRLGARQIRFDESRLWECLQLAGERDDVNCGTPNRT